MISLSNLTCFFFLKIFFYRWHYVNYVHFCQHSARSHPSIMDMWLDKPRVNLMYCSRLQRSPWHNPRRRADWRRSGVRSIRQPNGLVLLREVCQLRRSITSKKQFDDLSTYIWKMCFLFYSWKQTYIRPEPTFRQRESMCVRYCFLTCLNAM